MSHSFPYTFIACPCTPTKHQPFRPAEAPSLPEESDPDSYEELTFDPRSPRSNFSLFPPENLVFCDVCHQIKCSRCTTEEIVCWYCPACLFETPSSMVRSEGNR
jgi:dynactin-4